MAATRNLRRSAALWRVILPRSQRGGKEEQQARRTLAWKAMWAGASGRSCRRTGAQAGRYGAAARCPRSPEAGAGSRSPWLLCSPARTKRRSFALLQLMVSTSPGLFTATAFYASSLMQSKADSALERLWLTGLLWSAGWVGSPGGTRGAFPAEQDALPAPSSAPRGVGDLCLPYVVWWGSASAAGF